MRIIGEKLNGFIPEMGRAIETRDAEYVCSWARAQSEAGADYLDVCASGAQRGEEDALLWLIDLVQKEVDTPISIDTPDAFLMEKAMRMLKSPGMVNSVSLEGGAADRMFPQIRDRGFSCIALLMDGGVPKTVEGRIAAFEKTMECAEKYGIDHGKVYVDPLVTALGTIPESAAVFIETCREIRKRDAHVHVVGGVSNVSFGLPARRHINRAFVTMAMGAGMDCAICDPTDRDMMGIICAADALLGNDEMCAEYLQAYRQGKL